MPVVSDLLCLAPISGELLSFVRLRLTVWLATDILLLNREPERDRLASGPMSLVLCFGGVVLGLAREAQEAEERVEVEREAFARHSSSRNDTLTFSPSDSTRECCVCLTFGINI